MVGRGPLSGSAPPSDSQVQICGGVKLGDSGVVIGYQVDEFTHIWSVEYFIAQSHIHHSIMGKVSTVTHFPLELGCEDYSFGTRL